MPLRLPSAAQTARPVRSTALGIQPVPLMTTALSPASG